MKVTFYQIFTLSIIAATLFGCVSTKKFKASEWMRERYVQENLVLKQDTTMTGIRYRNVLKTSEDMVSHLGRLVSDTARLNRQVRLLLSEGSEVGADKGATLLKLLEKEKQLNEKEAKLIEKEMAMVKKEDTPSISEGVPDKKLLEEIKFQIGTYAVERVGIYTEGKIIIIKIPTEIVFSAGDKNIKGKGLSILIKLAELLKAHNYNSIEIVSTLRKEGTNATFIYDTRNLAASRATEVASLMERYGVLSQEISTITKLVDESIPLRDISIDIHIQ